MKRKLWVMLLSLALICAGVYASPCSHDPPVSVIPVGVAIAGAIVTAAVTEVPTGCPAWGALVVQEVYQGAGCSPGGGIATHATNTIMITGQMYATEYNPRARIEPTARDQTRGLV
jgi:hypothetical protein